jgi:DNA-binding NarL/FixJ family response regulator
MVDWPEWQVAANDGTADIPMVTQGESSHVPCVLVVSPDDTLRHATALYLRLVGGYHVIATQTLEGAAANDLLLKPGLLLVHAPHRKALSAAALQELRGRTGAALILLASGSDHREFEALRSLAPRDVFLMPADPQLLMDAVTAALHAVH